MFAFLWVETVNISSNVVSINITFRFSCAILFYRLSVNFNFWFFFVFLLLQLSLVITPMPATFPYAFFMFFFPRQDPAILFAFFIFSSISNLSTTFILCAAFERDMYG